MASPIESQLLNPAIGAGWAITYNLNHWCRLGSVQEVYPTPSFSKGWSFFSSHTTFRRGALAESILDGALVLAQTTYTLDAQTVDLVNNHSPVKIPGCPLPCFDDSGPTFEGVFTLPRRSVNLQHFLEMT